MRLKTLKTITSHPLTENNKFPAIVRLLKRGILVRFCRYPIIYPFIESAQLMVKKGMSSAELQIYTGLYDFNEMLFLLHVLNKNDLFVDVGANVGVYTILASKVKGSQSIAIEPIPDTFSHLLDNIAINHITHLVQTFNIGISDREDQLRFTRNLNSAVNHVELKNEAGENTIFIPVNSLDNILTDKNPFLIKIDVEGFEFMAIKGAEAVLKKDSLKAIIIELNGLSEKYGFDEREIHNTLIKNGFEPFNYLPDKRFFEKLTNFGEKNTIYIRDMDCLKERVSIAPKIKVLNNEF